MSQEQLATAVGASVRAVGDWENDRTSPRNLGVLVEVLGEEILGSAEPEVYTDPDEAALWALTAFTPEERRRMIGELRDRLAQQHQTRAS
jgi:transcriptional regulator with XRE-family HTH domain